MINGEFYPKKIFIDKSSLDFPLTQTILRNASSIPVEIVENIQGLIDEINTSKDPVGEGKKFLLVTQQKGEFIKPCPCTPHYMGCNYYIINLDLNCPLDCTYCILQHYLTNPLITAQVNLRDLWDQLDIFLQKMKNRIIRIGTGELGDSLVLDHITENSKQLISYFREKENVLLELKTKTVNIKNILAAEPAENIIIAWSINSFKMAEQEENGSPSISDRIDAAQLVVRRGFRVAFHFDPLVRYPGWREGYEEVIEELLRKVDPVSIAWISLGSLRFAPQLKPIIKSRFPKTKIVYEELIRGKDGKYRYFKPLRMQLYKEIIGFIKRNGGRDIHLYFCMESREIWKRMLEKKPRGEDEVSKLLSSPLK